MNQQLEQHLYTELEEKLMAETLRQYYTEGLSLHDEEQISAILKEQFTEGNSREIGGSIFRTDAGLELKQKKSVYLSCFEGLLRLFKEGEEKAREPLFKFAKKNIERLRNAGVTPQHHHYQMLEAICLLLSIPKIVGNDVVRKNIGQLYQTYVLDPVYLFLSKEWGAGQKGFNGIFHVHDNGSPPSPPDVEAFRRHSFPGLVVSATPDYQQSGLTLYLVHSQGYEKLYQGPFPSEEHINP